MTCFETEAQGNSEMAYFDSKSHSKFVQLFFSSLLLHVNPHNAHSTVFCIVSLGEEKSPDHIEANQAGSSNAELVKSWLKNYEYHI